MFRRPPFFLSQSEPFKSAAISVNRAVGAREMDGQVCKGNR